MKRIVTDEQAAEIRDGFFQTLIVSREYDENGNETRITARDVVADLIEARELIKEMRQVMAATIKTYYAEILPLATMRINELLDKSKDYI